MSDDASEPADPPDQSKGSAATQFRKGQSGNPGGRPRGSRNKATLLREHLGEENAQALVDRVATDAHNGDKEAARMLLPYLFPKPKAPVELSQLPEIKTVDDVLPACDALLQRTAAGELPPEDAVRLMDTLINLHRSLVTDEVRAEVEALKTQLSGEG